MGRPLAHLMPQRPSHFGYHSENYSRNSPRSDAVMRKIIIAIREISSHAEIQIYRKIETALSDLLIHK